MSETNHGGKREGAGRKPAPLPERIKKFRASDDEWDEIQALSTGDARWDFIIYRDALRRMKRIALDDCD